MKLIKKVLLLIIIFIPCICLAEEDVCNYKIRSQYSKLAANVKASYEIKKDEFGYDYIEITVYNITDGLSVKIYGTSRNNEDEEVEKTVLSEDTNDGVYSFKHYNINDVYKYSFKVNLVEVVCKSSLKSFSLTIPKYNKFSKLDDCKYYETADSIYCQEWTTNELNFSEHAVIEKLRKIRLDKFNKATTQCVSCGEEDSTDTKYKWMVRIWRLVIIGLAIGLVVDIVMMVYLYNKLKDYMRFDIEF